jgi:hypothetical protein
MLTSSRRDILTALSSTSLALPPPIEGLASDPMSKNEGFSTITLGIFAVSYLCPGLGKAVTTTSLIYSKSEAKI